ncbi:DUF3095 family protein [Roseibium marinum]|uniref:DUF3095 family protein n=1 Tax=Roseibium marinum TaxID=281252 RepID=A0A2S3V4D3_9HYPH|nr:DUF3095 family protein [Roseibium marinum]POF34821.1 Protein of unknown function (DUF3095) [Roseibium marinum]
MSADDFYSDLPSFSDFSSVGELDGYRPVPDDWYVLAADIVRSGDAVAAGRYKEVNMVGAAVIAAVVNRLGHDRVPFVFGGDGAMLVVCEQDVQAGREALAGVVDLARQVMELQLRAAAIPVAHLRALGGDIRLRKYRLSEGNHLAMILGDGLGIADRILKDSEASRAFAITLQDTALPPLDGLSCRWEPLPAQNGHIVSLIVKPSGRKTLPEVMDDVAEKLGFNPLTDDSRTRLAEKSRLRFRFPPRSLRLEVQMSFAGKALRGWVTGIAGCLLFMLSYATGWRIGPLVPAKYIRELSLNTDHRKVGDSLQLVLDLSPAQLAAVESCLEAAFEAGEVVYGMHVSGSALMTCFVEDIGNSRHIHFVDGADGGLSLAAEQFKKRQAALSAA